MPLTIRTRNKLKTVISAVSITSTTDPYEFTGTRNYTVYCSPALGSGETIVFEIYNPVTDTYNTMKMGGSTVGLSQNNDVLKVFDTSCVVRFVKSVTASATSLFISY